MAYKDHVNKMMSIQISIRRFIDQNYNIEENYQNLITLFNNYKISDEKHETASILHLISKISENHHRHTTFFDKIEQILLFFSDCIKKNYTNFEIFNFFKKNKRILLFLIESQILFIDEIIYNYFTKEENTLMNYKEFFEPEVTNFINELTREFEEEEDDDDEILNLMNPEFKLKRKIGENEDYLCELIRKDRNDDFIAYFTSKSIDINAKIKPSKYETNIFLIKNKETTLIEYAAFFGSIRIFKFLYSNKAKFTQKIWLYTIHGNNFDLFLFIKDNLNFEQEISYKQILKEAIKCHHIELANYIQYNYLNQKDFDDVYSYSLHYYNYMLFPEKFNCNLTFYYACKYDYFNLVKLLLKASKVDTSIEIIHHNKNL